MKKIGKKFTKLQKDEKGITLVALVITIVILIILATIAINFIFGNNGLITRTNEAKERTEVANEKEIISLAQISVKINNVDEQFIQKELEEEINKQKPAVVAKNGDKLIVKFKDTGNRYEIENNIISESNRNNEDVLSKYESEEYINQEIGISETGNLVDMNLWDYTIEDESYKNLKFMYISNSLNSFSNCGYNTVGDGTINLARSEVDESMYNIYSGYKGEIKDGKIIGEIPQYIKPAGRESFIEVTKMVGTFMNNTELEEAPYIPENVTALIRTFCGCTSLNKIESLPNGVTSIYYIFKDCVSLEQAPKINDNVINMNGAFLKCTSLLVAPKIPNSVETIQMAFSGCTSLEEAPYLPEGITDLQGLFFNCTKLNKVQNIPSTVTMMGRTFSGCTSLSTVPEIPRGVTYMWETFYNCSNLNGDLVINSNPTQYQNCLNGAATNEGVRLILSGESSILSKLLATKSSNSNIELLKENS